MAWRARLDEEVGPIVGRMRLLTGNAIERMRSWEGEAHPGDLPRPNVPAPRQGALVKRKCACSGPWSAMTWMPGPA